MILEAWDSAVTSGLHPAIRNPGPTTAPTQNLAESELLKLTFHDTTNRCHRNGLRLTPVVFDGHARGWEDSARYLATWISHRLSTNSLRTPTDINLELAQRISSSLHREFVCAILGRVRLVLSRDAPTPLGLDDWCPAWDDPDPDGGSADFDSLTERSDESGTTTTT